MEITGRKKRPNPWPEYKNYEKRKFYGNDYSHQITIALFPTFDHLFFYFVQKELTISAGLYWRRRTFREATV